MRVYLNFVGFYESLFTQQLEDQVSQDADYVRENGAPENVETQLWDAAYKAPVHTYIAMAYADRFDEWLAKAMDAMAPDGAQVPEIPAFKFVALHHPREYNFFTDDVECEVDSSFMATLYYWLKRYFHDEFRDYMVKAVSPRSGFIPFASSARAVCNEDLEAYSPSMWQLLFTFIEEVSEYRADEWFIEEDSYHGYFSDALNLSTDYVLLMNRYSTEAAA